MDYKSKKSTLSGEKSQGSGHFSDKPQQKNSASRVDAGHGGGIIHCPVTKNMKHLMDEFKGLYEERLRRLEFDTRGGTKDDILQMKVRILQSYVNDLGDQNQVLVQTVEDLETEANNRVCTIDAKLHTSDQIIHDLEQQRRVLEESVCSLRSENQDLKTDMDSLTNFIQRARHQHTLVSGGTLRTASLEKIVETSTYTPTSPNPEVEDLRSQVRTRDRTILSLERDSNTFQLVNNTLNKTEPFQGSDAVVYLQRQVCALQSLQREKVAAITERDITITKLHTEVQLLQEQGPDNHTQLSKQKDRVRQLEEEVKKREAEQREAEEEWRKRGEEHGQRELERKREEDERKEEQRKREEKWKKKEEEQREARALARKEWEEKASNLNAEVDSVREEGERQRREILTLRQREKTLLSEVCMLEEQLKELQHHYGDSEEDNGRLRARLEAHTITLHDQQEILTQELRRTEGVLHSLRMQLQDRDSQLENATNNIFTLENFLKEAEESCVAAKTEVQNHFTLLEEMSRELGRLTLAENKSVDEVNERGEMLRHMKQDLSALRATQDSLKRTLSMKEQHTHQLTHDNTHLRENLDTLKNKLLVSENRVCTLSVELDQVKISLGEERDQCQHLQDQVLQQSQDLERVNHTLTDTRRAACRKIHKKDSKLSVLLKELAEVRKHFSDCKQELLSRESALAKQQEETAQLRSKMEDCSSECSALNREKERLETDLTLTNQKHCTAQGEVSRRDQVILQLRTELSKAEQKFQGTQEELAMLEAEVSRLNQKVKGQQEEACLLRQMVREGEGLRDQEVTEQQQIQNTLCIAQQQVRAHTHTHTHTHTHSYPLLCVQVKSQTMSIEQITSDLDSMKQNHRADTKRWSHRHFLLRSQLEQASSELIQSQNKVREHGSEVTELRGKLQLAEEGYQEALEKVEEAKGLVNTRDTETELLRQQLKAFQEDLSETTSRAQGQEEKVAIFKKKYCVAMEKVQQLQGHIECVQEELSYTQQQLTESKAAVGGVKAEVIELEGRYQEKLGQWERSEEALDQLTGELQANQMALREGRERVKQCEGTIQHLQQEMDTQKTQQVTEQVERLANCERALLQMRAEYLRQEEELERQSQEKAGLERTLQSLHLDLAASHSKHLVTHTQLEQEVTQLQEEVTRLQEDLVDTHNTCTQREQTIQGQEVLLQQVEEGLKETRLLLQRRTTELKEEREEMKRRTRELEGEREEMKRRTRELEEEKDEAQILKEALLDLHRSHRQTVEELSCRGEEVWRLEGSVKEGRQEEEDRRRRGPTVERLERQSAELRLALQQAMENTLNTQRDNQTTQEQVKTLEEENNSLTNQVRTLEERYSSLTTQLLRSQRRGQENVQRLANQEERLVILRTESETLQDKYSSKVQELDTLRLEVERVHSDNTHLRQESQVVMANVNRWVKEQRVASESLAAKIRGQNKVLLIISEEKQHLQEANRALEEELRKLGDEVEEKEREMERLKAQVQDRGQQQEEERESFVTTNLSRIQYMQVRLRGNLEAIGVLNKQLSALGGENERLRRQLEEERAERRQVERLIPPTNHQRGTSLLPLSLIHGPSSSLPSLSPSLDRDTGYPPPASHLSPSPLHHTCNHSPSPRPGEKDSALTRAELSVAGPREPGETQAVNEAYWVRRVGQLSVQLQDNYPYSCRTESSTGQVGSTTSLQRYNRPRTLRLSPDLPLTPDP